MRTVVVEVHNDILGDSVFWRGAASQIEEIANIPARITARAVIKDGKPRKCGMWFVYLTDEKVSTCTENFL